MKGEQVIRDEVCESQVEWRAEIEIRNLQVCCNLLSDQALLLISNHCTSLG